MIVFYNNKTGDILSVMSGRIHSQKEIDSAGIVYSNIPSEDISKYVVSFKATTKKMIRDVTKMMVDPETLEVKTVKVGEEEIEVPDGLRCTDPMANLFEKVETGELNIYDCHFLLGSNGEIVGWQKP